ncbi:MAG: GC-type dockerin domain-anchored protein [bacterium]
MLVLTWIRRCAVVTIPLMAFAVALFWSGSAHAQTIYYSGTVNIPIPDRGAGSPTIGVWIDYQGLTPPRQGGNAEGGEDLKLTRSSSTSTGSASFITVTSRFNATTNGGITFLNGSGFPPRLPPVADGASIGPGTYPSLAGGTIGGTAAALVDYQNQTRFIGFRIRGADATTFNYGWMRLEVGADFHTSKLVDFALQTTPNTPINAGEGIVIVPPFFEVTSSPSPSWLITGRTAVLSGLATADPACGAISYRWQRNGVDIVDGPGGASPSGGTVVNANGPNLVITNLATSDAGTYTLVATTPSCGVRTSTAASLVVYPSNLWTVSNLHPLGASESWSYGITGLEQQAGQATFDGLAQAVLVNSAAGTWINLHPLDVPANSTSSARGMATDQIAGITTIVNPFPIGNRSVATLWTRTAGVWTWNNINPVPPAVPSAASFSIANATDGVQQVGAATVEGQQVAALWSGTGDSFVSLNPPGSIQSEANGVRNGQQVGSAFVGFQQASLWSSTAESWVSLNPAGATLSVATGTDGTQQVGYANINIGADRASLWAGSPGTWVDLHPVGFSSSRAQAVANGQQVGSAALAGSAMAAIWTGSASSHMNLHAYLPAGFIRSQAESIWSEGEYTSISGVAIDAATGLPFAVQWTKCVRVGIGTQPVPISTCASPAATFTTSASGTPPFTYQWRRNGTPIDPQANASAATATLTIPSVQVGDSGSYDCTITNACGSATSNAATLAVTQCCGPSDVAGPGQNVGPDGELTADDIIVFLNWFFAGDSRADVAGPGQSTSPDGEFTADDIIVFLNAFFAGC